MNTEIKKNLKEAYDTYAKESEGGEGNELRPWQVQQREQFLYMLQAEHKHSLLELGAGTGGDSRFFADHGFTVLAIDLSSEMVRICREQGIETLEMDLYDLDQIKQQFDAIWAMNSLIHIEKVNLSSILQMASNALKPTGLLFISVYGGYDFEGVFESDVFTPQRYFSFYTDEALIKILEQYFDLIQFTSVESTARYHSQCIVLRKR